MENRGNFALAIFEAATGFEPVHNGFADRSLTTWVRRLKLTTSPTLPHLLRQENQVTISEKGPAVFREAFFVLEFLLDSTI